MCLRRRCPILAAVLFLFSISTLAQPGQGNSTTVQVRVVFTDDRPVEDQLRVELTTSSGLGATTAFTDSTGMAFFGGVRAGSYRVRVTGQDIVETLGNIFMIDPRERSHSETITVQRKDAPSASAGAPGAIALVDLNVPKQAQKDFDKGAEAFNRSKLDDARKQLEKAIAQYPNFASAYNLLGLTWMRQGEPQRGQEAFEKAISINDRYAQAYANLAKVFFGQRKFDRSEVLLEKSLANDPRNPETLTILAQVELMAGKYEQAAANARRVHDVPHKDYAIAHFVAARALRSLNQREQAVAEYKVFLQEAPASTSSPQARQELAQLEAQKP